MKNTIIKRGNLEIETFKESSAVQVILTVSGSVIMHAFLEGDAYELWGDKMVYYPWGMPYEQKVEQVCFNILLNHPIASGLSKVEERISAEDIREMVTELKDDLLTVPTTYIIVAGGKSTRWKNYKGIEKHMIEFDGEPIIERTIRLLRTHGVEDIVVASDNSKYKFKGAGLYKPKYDPKYIDANKYMDSKPIWNKEGRTVILFGDVYFTESAIYKIVNDFSRRWMLYGRSGPSNIGKPYSEPFGIGFYPNEHKLIESGANRSADLFRKEIANGTSLCHLYRCLLDFPDHLINSELFGERMVIIDDLTDDFDIPEDYIRFVNR